MVQPLLGRTAFAVLHFLELLVGPRCQSLAVKNPQRYNFDKHELMMSMVQLAGQLARYPEFTQVGICKYVILCYMCNLARCEGMCLLSMLSAEHCLSVPGTGKFLV